MSRVDGRKLSHDVREAIRMEAIQSWIDGATPSELAVKHGTDLTCVYGWINRYKDGGFEALKTRPITGRPPKLSDAQRTELAEILLCKNPTDFGFYKAMWTRDIVASVIKQRFSVTMHPAAVGKMLKRMGFSPQRPTRKAWQQSKKKSMNG